MARVVFRGFVALACASTLALAPMPAAHAGPTVPAAPPPAPIALLSPDLAGVPVDSPEYRTAQKAYDTTASQLADTRSLLANAEAELDQLHGRDTSLTAQLATDTQRKKEATIDLAASRQAVRALAIHQYVNGSTVVDDVTADPDEALQALNEEAVASVVRDEQLSRLSTAATALDDAARAIGADVTQRTDVRKRIVDVDDRRAHAADDEARLTTELGRRQTDLDRARAVSTVVGEDFQLVALDAYWRAAQALAVKRPQCGIPWWALAGITRVESRHGQYGGATLGPDGADSQRIIGIPLDGTNDTELIPDTDGGALDGDPDFDHAVGPMQFIPETWNRWADDGNGDGNKDPYNIYDAALAAGRYLCASGPMQSDDQLVRGFLSYNHSDAYARAVFGFAQFYLHLVIPPPPPPVVALPSVASPP